MIKNDMNWQEVEQHLIDAREKLKHVAKDIRSIPSSHRGIHGQEARDARRALSELESALNRLPS